MSERDGFLRAICADPEDDTVRLAFADWLQEHGESDRAEFIRLHIEWCRRDPNLPADDDLWLRMGVAWEASGLPRSAPRGDTADAYDRGFVAGAWFGRGTTPDRVEAAMSAVPLRVAHFSLPTEADAVRLADSPSLARLRGLSCSGPSDAIGRLLSSPYLGGLNFLAHEEEDRAKAQAFANSLASAPHLNRLTVLDFDGCHLEDVGLAILAGCDHLRTVRKLTLDSGGRVSHLLGEMGLRALAESRSLTGLTHLGLNDCYIYGSGLRQLLQWPGAENLLELNLGFTALDGEAVVELARCQQLKSLRRLRLDFFSMTDEALNSLTTAAWLPHLRELWIVAREYYPDREDQSEEAVAEMAAKLGPRLIMPTRDGERFKLSEVVEAERIWQRLRHSGYRDQTGLNLPCIE